MIILKVILVRAFLENFNHRVLRLLIQRIINVHISLIRVRVIQIHILCIFEVKMFAYYQLPINFISNKVANHIIRSKTTSIIIRTRNPIL